MLFHASVAFCLVASASALTTPIIHRHVHNHRTLRPRATPPKAIQARSSFTLQNGEDAQALNAKFATLTVNSACTDGAVACIGGLFAQCAFGKYVTTACSAPLQCVALPLLNSQGTSVTCDYLSDALQRIADTGASGGLTGTGSAQQGATGTVSRKPVTTTTRVSKPTTTLKHTTAKSPTTTAKPATTKKSTTVARPTTTAGDSTTTSGSTLAVLHGTQTGDATWYATGLGACGIVNTDSDHIIAVSHVLFDEYPGYKGGNPNNNPICNKQIRAHYNGNSVLVTVTDRCEACLETDLDFAPSAFQVLESDLGKGRLHGMTWEWA